MNRSRFAPETENLNRTAREWRALASELARAGELAGARSAEHYARECETAARELARPVVVPRPFRGAL